ncbi:MAG: arsenic resistance protein [Candidatus Thorarchaeota archaeon]|nr:arsenic resistance protein [Candidatus Thorarchaeota archaeon]
MNKESSENPNTRSIDRIKNNLSKYLLPYTFIVMLLGFTTGYYFQSKIYSQLVLPVVFIMIYPMMINMSISHLKKVKGSIKPLILALILNFVYAPIIMYFLVDIFVPDIDLAIALIFLAIAPASSMGLGYIGLAEGHMLTGSIIVTTAFLVSLVAYPIFGIYLAGVGHITIPAALLIQNLIIVIVLPFALGIGTREYIERHHGIKKYGEIKAYFSTTTLAALYVLMFLIFASKAHLILEKYTIFFMIAPVALIFYPLTTYLITHVNKRILNLEYGTHQSVVFTSVSKNVALAIAIFIAVFGEVGQYMAVAPAIMSLFQAPFLMGYLRLSDRVKSFFSLKEDDADIDTP